jgi:hypothetical protein
MADIKREIRGVGQRLSGLSAGNSYTFVLKKPKPTVDIENARRATSRALDQLAAITQAAAELDSARDEAGRGEVQTARGSYARAKSLLSGMNRGLADAKEYARCAADDAKDAPGEVKDEYDIAKDSAEAAVQLADQAVQAVEGVTQAIGAIIEAAAAKAAGNSDGNAASGGRADSGGV